MSYKCCGGEGCRGHVIRQSSLVPLAGEYRFCRLRKLRARNALTFCHSSKMHHPYVNFTALVYKTTQTSFSSGQFDSCRNFFELLMRLPGVVLHILWFSVFAKCGNVTVTGPSGISYQGIRDTGTNQDVFRSIPYADPPIGTLRFRPPHPWSPTNNIVIDATGDRPVCIQSTPIDYSDVSEDCLHLSLCKCR